MHIFNSRLRKVALHRPFEQRTGWGWILPCWSLSWLHRLTPTRPTLILQEGGVSLTLTQRDLYQAIVIATLLTGPGHKTAEFFENGKRYFKSAYRGKTVIFEES